MAKNVKGDINWLGAQKSINQSPILPKASGYGLKVDTDTPTFPWRDIIGDVTPRAGGGAARAAFRGGQIQTWFYTANDLCDMYFHIPHDYVPGSDLYLHLHWAHNGTAISGSLVVDFFTTYAKGHNQTTFPAEITPQLSVSTPNVTSFPRYQHIVSEIQLSAASPGANQLDSDDIEVDGMILIALRSTTIPTITGGSTNAPAFFTCDLHYQSIGIGTKQKAPPFYT